MVEGIVKLVENNLPEHSSRSLDLWFDNTFKSHTATALISVVSVITNVFDLEPSFSADSLVFIEIRRLKLLEAQIRPW